MKLFFHIVSDKKINKLNKNNKKTVFNAKWLKEEKFKILVD